MNHLIKIFEYYMSLRESIIHVDDMIYNSLPGIMKVIHIVPLAVLAMLLMFMSVVILPIHGILRWRRYIIEDPTYDIYPWAIYNNYYAVNVRNFHWFTNKILVHNTNIELLYRLSQ